MIFLGYCNQPLKSVSVNNQECKRRSEIININRNEPSFYPYFIKVNKCSGSCNNTNNPYEKFGVPDVVKNINGKVFNLIPRNNKQDIQNDMKLVNVNEDQMQVLVIINNVGIKVNECKECKCKNVNVKN